MMQGTLREMVCALQAMPGDIFGGVFNWTLKIRQLFVRVQAGDALDDEDLLALDRACEIATTIARTLHARSMESRFDDYRAAIARDLSDDDYYLAHYTLEAALRQRRTVREKTERDYQQAWAQALVRRMNDTKKAT